MPGPPGEKEDSVILGKVLVKVLVSVKRSMNAGEFGIGVNPWITQPMRKILFDEKILGSHPFYPGPVL